MASSSSFTSSGGGGGGVVKTETIQCRPPPSLIKVLLSWTLEDVKNQLLYQDKVEKIPETFSSIKHYLNSFCNPLLEEIHTEFFHSISNLSQSPVYRILSVKRAKNYKAPNNLYYELTVDNADSLYPCDIIAFSDVIPSSIDDLNRAQRPYLPAAVLSKSYKYYNETIHILASKPIVFFQGHKKKIEPLFAISVMNIVSCNRIWEALHSGNSNIIEQVLCPSPLVIESCGICPQELDSILEKDECKDLNSCNLNDTQLDAVLSSISTIGCDHKNSVKLIWGPPGTGKTKTVGTLLSVLLKMNCKTVICAPTNNAVVEVASRLLAIVREEMKYGGYGLGDIVLLGNKDRMKIDEREHLQDIFFDYRVKKLKKCFRMLNGKGTYLEWMRYLFKKANRQYLDYLEEKKSEEMQDKTLDSELTIRDFVRMEFGFIRKKIRNCIRHICTHMPTSLLPVKMVEDMYRALELLELLRTSLDSDSLTDQNMIELFSNSNTVDNISDSSLLLLSKTKKECLESLKSIGKFSVSYNVLKGSMRDFCLQNACLVFCTSSGCAKLYKIKKTKVVVIDEAAQLKECESAIPLRLPGIRHAILIGDERQLPALVHSKISEEAQFGRSLFERMVLLGYKRHLLSTQFRMHPSISAFPNAEFYNSRISDAPNVKDESYKRELLQGDMYGPYTFIDVFYGSEEFNSTHSCKNMVEVVVICEIVESLFEACVSTNQRVSVGIISQYKEQVLALTEKLDKYVSNRDFVVSVRSVDGFQGGEEDVIILSTVRSNLKGSVGFLSNPQRTNVSLTRARYCLWIVGDGRTLIKSDSVWRKLVLDAKDRECYFYAEDDKRLSRAILYDLVQRDPFLNLNTMYWPLFREARWTVIFGDGFLNAFCKIKHVKTRIEVVDLLIKLASGWRDRSSKQKNLKNIDRTVSELLKQNKINEHLSFVWTVDVQNVNTMHIQVMKVLDIRSQKEMPELAKKLKDVFGKYTIKKRNYCKFKCLEGDMEVPMSWEEDVLVRKSIQDNKYSELLSEFDSLSLGRELNVSVAKGQSLRTKTQWREKKTRYRVKGKTDV